MRFRNMGLFPLLLEFIFISGVLQICMAQVQGPAHRHRYEFVLQNAHFEMLCSGKSMLTVNGMFPGPELRVHRGDTAFVNVRNNASYGVTIHWHGVKQPRNPWSDGPENITQCPIRVGGSFIQKIIFSNEEGTLWWHAHNDWSRATVHGAIVVLPPQGTLYPYPKQPDGEETIILSSWYKGDVMAVIDEALATGGDPNISDAFTINGMPGDLYECSNASTSYHLWVNHGKTYLLRIINAVLNEEMWFGITKHKLIVVGSDGAYIKPINTDYIMITPGQTMDVLITADQYSNQYYIAASPYADSKAPFDNTTVTAIVEYGLVTAAPLSKPLPELPSYNDKTAADNFTKQMKSLADERHPIKVPLNISKRMYVTIAVNQIYCNGSCGGPDGNRLAATLNNVSFQSPVIDILQAYVGNMSNVYTGDFPDKPPYYYNFTGNVGNNTIYPSLGTKVEMINYGEEVEIIFQGTNVRNAENHPMHLHGYSFYVVGMGYGNFDPKKDPKTYNLKDPPEVNTFGVPKNGWLTIRFLAENPGVWFMHCHLERHASWGMNTVLIVKNGTTKDTSLRPKPNNMPPCVLHQE